MITPAAMNARGVRVITRPWGHVILTSVLGQNTEAFRKQALPWLDTPAGAAWLLAEGRLA